MAYNLALNLDVDSVHVLLPEPKSSQEHYVTALAEALELLLTENPDKFTEYESSFTQRKERKTKVTSPEDLFLQAEIRLQWAFVYLKFGHEFDGAVQLREAYNITQEIKKRFPKFTAIQKTSGLLDVIIGSVPEKYEWILGLFNMEGSVDMGLRELEKIQSSDHTLAFEASLLLALTQGFILQKTEVALAEVKKDLMLWPTNRLALFLGGALAMKNSNSEEALVMINKLTQQSDGMRLYYANYLKGEIYLHKAEYLNAISSYRWFANHYKGQNYIKDANYKIGLCYLLNGNTSDALAIFAQVPSLGRESTEADKYAARSCAEKELPHVKLTTVRYYTDGGYLDNATKFLENISDNELITKRDRVEYHYRKARVAHKTNNLLEAKEFYLQTVQLSGEEPWYFAPNASLQLGYLAMNENNSAKAKEYFTLALTYKKHAYKNSIDSKAKSALAQLNERK